MKKLVVFDWDGTVMDSSARIVASMQGAAADLNIAIPEDEQVRDIIGLSLDKAIAIVFPQYPEFAQSLYEGYRSHYLTKCQIPTRLFEGAESVLTQLSECYTLAVATGKSRKGLDRVLTETALQPLFAATRCADETSSKPDPHMLYELFEQLDIQASQAIMIGDTEYDMVMGKRAGSATLGVTYGVHTVERLQATGADACIDDIRDLPEWLYSHFG